MQLHNLYSVYAQPQETTRTNVHRNIADHEDTATQTRTTKTQWTITTIKTGVKQFHPQNGDKFIQTMLSTHDFFFSTQNWERDYKN